MRDCNSVDAQVQGRPKGDLPATVAGASPAYNLGGYDSDVLRLVIRLK